MQIIRQLSPDVLNRPARTILTIGAYDGIHRGHKQIISGLKEAARAADALSALITFYPRPKVALGHSHANADYLTTLEEKLFIFESLGLEVVAVLPFTSELAQTSPRAFIRRIVDALHPLAFWVGPDFKFGQDRQGDIPALRELGLEFGFSVRVIDQQMAQGEIISSTRIRLALLGGQIREVTRLLGDYPFWLGEVVHGAKRGRKIGFPTANVAVGRDKILPANGVYAVWFHLAEQVYPLWPISAPAPLLTAMIALLKCIFLILIRIFTGKRFGWNWWTFYARNVNSAILMSWWRRLGLTPARPGLFWRRRKTP